MTDLPPRTRDGADDARLLERARAGDSDAFGEIYQREVDPARRLARILVGEDGADELVAESFARVLTQLQAGRGPTEDFRAYLHVTIRNGFRDGLRGAKESPSSDQPWLLDDVLPPVEELVEDLDRDVAVTALATLPKSWQQVLWHLEVEGRKPAEVAGLLDMDAGAVSSLAHRAREGLKRAYLDQHLQPATAGQCGWTQSRMSQYVRGDLSARAQLKVAAHLDDCSSCDAAYLAVERVNQKLAAWLFPVVLWGVTGSTKGGLLWFAGAAGAGGAGASSTPTTTPAASGPNPVVVGTAATVVACGIAAGVAFAVLAAKDDPARGTVGAGAPATTDVGATPQSRPSRPADQAAPPPGRTDQRPAYAPGPTEASTTDVSTPIVIPTPSAPTRPAGDLTKPSPPTTAPPTTAPPTTAPPATPVPPPPPPPPPPPVPPPGDTPVTASLGDPDVTVADRGTPARGPFVVTVPSVVTGTADATLVIALDFAGEMWRVTGPAEGWDCGVLDELLPTGNVTCSYVYTGAPPPPLVLQTAALLPAGPAVKPDGTVTLAVDGQEADTGDF